MNTCNKGASSELQAAAWLLGQGYEVFRNVSPVGPVDLVAYDKEIGEVILIDVKTASNGSKPGYLSAEQEYLGVRRLIYNTDTKTFTLEVYRKGT